MTAASAIAALQEAGSKLSRDMLKSSYRAFAQVNYLCVELIRQFYQEERWFRVVGETGCYEYLKFSGGASPKSRRDQTLAWTWDTASRYSISR